MLNRLLKNKKITISIALSMFTLTLALISLLLMNYHGQLIYKETTDNIAEFANAEKFIRYTHMIMSPLVILVLLISLIFIKKEKYVYFAMVLLIISTATLTTSLFVYNANIF